MQCDGLFSCVSYGCNSGAVGGAAAQGCSLSTATMVLPAGINIEKQLDLRDTTVSRVHSYRTQRRCHSNPDAAYTDVVPRLCSSLWFIYCNRCMRLLVQACPVTCPVMARAYRHCIIGTTYAHLIFVVKACVHVLSQLLAPQRMHGYMPLKLLCNVSLLLHLSLLVLCFSVSQISGSMAEPAHLSLYAASYHGLERLKTIVPCTDAICDACAAANDQDHDLPCHSCTCHCL